MQRIKVANGIWWVSIPEEGLSVLCGCPADSVKHLIKRGLISTVEHEEKTFETGPNAVLLSDVAVQNGEFANLAEFSQYLDVVDLGLDAWNDVDGLEVKPALSAHPMCFSQGGSCSRHAPWRTRLFSRSHMTCCAISRLYNGNCWRRWKGG